MNTATGPRARFFRAVAKGGTFPESRRKEIVFCGRSNVGKSSLLNALTGVRGLARTSKTPGRTREIHFYQEGDGRFLVDLPGYGYAKVSLTERDSWKHLVESYLAHPSRIGLAILLVDARHPPFEMDLGLAEALTARQIPFVVALTKSDKIGSSGRAAAAREAGAAFPGALQVVLTSAKTKMGMKELTRRIESDQRSVKSPLTVK